MSYGFDENMGKVPIEPILNTLEQTYQSNVNTIYNTIKNQGTTPAGKTPAQIATAINNMASAKFNAGVSAADARSNPSSYNYQSGKNAGIAEAQAVAWSQTFLISAGSINIAYLYNSASVNFGLRNVTSGSINNTGGLGFTISYLNSGGGVISTQVVGDNASVNLSIPSGAQSMRLDSNYSGAGQGITCELTLNYKCQVLR
jgi:hypothetical protein